ncbi:MAG TPA: hypothetical protein VE553_10510 [Candidatus Binatia bacterium]|nr:hypothetical protein [Candidatus Binatia bacterium]
MKTRQHWYVTLLLLLVTLGACQSGQPEACDEGGTLFNDEFSGERDCGWAIYSRNGAASEIAEGTLNLTTSQPGQIWWTNPGRSFDDVIVSAEVAHTSGPQDNAYGVICRYQSSENFYVFLISSDGYYAIGKYQSGSDQIEYLTGDGQYVASEAINQGQARNSLRASCVGNELSITVNGELLETLTDPTFVTGDIGLAVSTFEPGTLVVSFDNVRVLAP